MAKKKQKQQKLSITPDISTAKPVKKVKKKKKSKSKPEDILKLLEPYSKEQLIDLAIDSAILNPTLVANIQAAADGDISHREIFVFGLPWNTTNETLAAEFNRFGEIESCYVVMDKATGKTKGYAFIVFKSRKSALKALKKPKKVVDDRLVTCQLSCFGSKSSSMHQNGNIVSNPSARKIFVNNVLNDANPERLRSFFASFGEIESGPTGFDPNTGKFKGYALFVYKTLEGAKKALEVPIRVFEGRQLHCRKALEGDSVSGRASGITTSVQAVPPAYAALINARGQNMGLMAQNPNSNVNSGLMGSNAASIYGDPNAPAGLMNRYPYGGFGQQSGGFPMGMGMGGYNGMYGNYGPGNMSGGYGPGSMSGGYGSGSMSGGYGTGTMSGLPGGAGSSSSQPMMQGFLNPYPTSSYAGNPSISGRPFR